MEEKNVTCEKAIEFIKKFFKIYLEDRDFAMVLLMLHQDISWVGTGRHEICKNHEDALSLMEAERKSWGGYFKIVDQWYKSVAINDKYCMVYGELKIVEDGFNTIIEDMDSRFSMLCCIDGENISLYHAHFSVPNEIQGDDEFVHKKLVKEYNILLEKKLEERTKILKSKTHEIEMLANNIYGGILICDCDDDCTILYSSDGFTELTGYSKEEIKDLLDNKHVNLMFSEDIEDVQTEVFKQLDKYKKFAVEYRITRKDNEVIWVLDKGVFVPTDDGKMHLQCILTDITKQKLQEELLIKKGFELQTITNNIDGAIFCCDYNAKLEVKFANDGFYRIIGYNKEQFENECGNMVSILIHPNEIADLQKDIECKQFARDSISYVNRLIRKDGSIIWILAKGAVVKKADDLWEFHGVFTDITEQKNIEETLRISEKRFEIAIGFTDVIMYEYDVFTKDLILIENEAKLFGVSQVTPNGPEEFVRSGLVDSSTAGVFMEMFRKIHAGEPSAQCFIKARDLGGVYHDYELGLTSVFDDNGKVIRAIGVRKNITQLRKLEIEKEYSTTMASDQLLIYEVNVSRDKIISRNNEWAEETGALYVDSFSETKNISAELIEPEFREQVSQLLSKRTIIDAFERGEQLITLDYRKRDKTGESRWVRLKVNIIKDSLTGDIHIRCYIVDIHDNKMKELRVLEEQSMFEKLVPRATVIYKANITQNLIISGSDNWDKLFGFSPTSNYSEMLDQLGKKAIHPQDLKGFNDIFLRQNILNKYKNGMMQLVYEYRRPDDEGQFIWVRCTLNIFKDIETGDIMGHAYIENINTEKQKEIELIYNAEHDLLTGLYNHSSAKRYIREFLSTSEGKAGRHGFFIIDIDHFKAINDNFGHAFGDAVLSQVGAKIQSLFRDTDILGRIGGDEFIAFMKNMQSNEIALAKAQEMCDKIQDSFSENNRVHKIATSIGIAIYNEHGKEYEDLYKNSDTALYVSKENGRNQYTLYNDNMGTMDLMKSGVNGIVSSEFTKVTTFSGNVSEYVFRILYESKDKNAAINSVLGLIGKHYDLGRTYVFEDSEDGKYTSNTFEWCKEGVTKQIDNLQNIPYKELGDYRRRFDENGTYYMQDTNDMDQVSRDLLKLHGMKSVLQFTMVKDDTPKCFIGFDECKIIRIPSKQEILELQNIVSILSLFIMEMRAFEINNKIKNMSLSIINGLASYAYVCNPKTYEVLFLNKKTLEIATNAKVGELCYETFQDRSEPCENCPMKGMITRKLDTYSVEMLNPKFKIWVKVSSSWIDWVDGEKMCLIDSFDITKYKS